MRALAPEIAAASALAAVAAFRTGLCAVGGDWTAECFAPILFDSGGALYQQRYLVVSGIVSMAIITSIVAYHRVISQYVRYAYDAGGRCISTKLSAQVRDEGKGCQPGLAYSGQDHFANVVSMLVAVARKETCDKRRERQIGLPEVHEHVRVLRARAQVHQTMNERSTVAVGYGINMFAFALTIVPACIPFFPAVRDTLPEALGGRFLVPIALVASAICLLGLAVIKRQAARYMAERRDAREKLLELCDEVLATRPRWKLRRRLNSRLQRGDLHAVYELNRGRESIASGPVLSVAAVVMAAVSCAVIIRRSEIVGAAAVLREAFTRPGSPVALAGGGSDGLLVAMIHVLAAIVAVPMAYVAWSEML